ncbi:hypothetical protein [Heminiphilus faecis]|uniref:hypothetical protein n=1 Tax=Heminiphilus faecis TaxID=2601703 RepID=UPI00196766A3|nr:hypothetical protein [Heminiphilus faecis]
MDFYDFLLLNNADNIKQKNGIHISDVSARKGTYSPTKGEKQPCIRVYLDKTDRKTYYQFAPLFRIIGDTSVLMTEVINGDWNTDEELDFKWDDFSLDLKDVKRFVLFAYS